MTDADFKTDLDHLYALMNQAVPRGVVLPGSVEGQAANAADIPWMRGQFTVQYRDRCAEILAEWPQRIWPEYEDGGGLPRTVFVTFDRPEKFI